jgi:hypothetical protein
MSKRKLLKAYPFLEEVDSFSIQAALVMYKVRPHWLNYAYLAEREGDKYWNIKIESSFESEHRRILFSSHDYRLTVYYFDWFHGHLYIGERHPKAIDIVRLALEGIDAYCREEWVIAYTLGEDGRLRSGRGFSSDELDKADLSKYHYITSWLGTYDKNLLEE